MNEIFYLYHIASGRRQSVRPRDKHRGRARKKGTPRKNSISLEW